MYARSALSEAERAYIQQSKAVSDREAKAHEARVQHELELERHKLELERRERSRLLQLVWLIGVEATIASVIAIFYLYQLILPFWVRSPTTEIASGTAVIGTNDPQADKNERPLWRPQVAAFAIERYEVSNQQYQQCVQARRCSQRIFRPEWQELPDLPVVGVTAYQAAEYCAWVGRRLPTELEWEYAARSSQGDLWPWGDIPVQPDSSYAHLLYDELTSAPDSVQSHAQGGRAGVLNLIGNVWEWTMSYSQFYSNYDSTLVWNWDPVRGGPIENSALVQRGGSFQDTLRRATEHKTAPAFEPDPLTGFRYAAPR
jgi:formylglycine-generating enzyme required for sulfatase activity